MVKSELEMPINEVVLYTNSQVVLGHILTALLCVCREQITTDQKFFSTKPVEICRKNPADIETRCISAKKLQVPLGLLAHPSYTMTRSSLDQVKS